MTTTTVKAADAAEFLSVIPRLLGFHPARSVVLIPFHGSRSLGAMRFDLPGGDGDAVDRVASTVVGMVCRLPDADAVAAIAYTDKQFRDEGGIPHADLAEALERRIHACGLRLADALCVAGDAWGSYLDPACPRTGRPLAELGPARVDLPDLPEPSKDQLAGTELPATDLAERELVGRALAALGQAVHVLCGDGDDSDSATTGADPTDGGQSTTHTGNDAAHAGGDAVGHGDQDAADRGEDAASRTAGAARIDPRALEAVCVMDDLPKLFEDALEWDPESLDPFEVACLIWCLARPALRDVALVQWSGDLAQGDEALDARVRWESGAEYPPDLAMRLWGEGARPDPDRLESALRLTRRVAAVAPRASRPGPLAMCAWLSWALGRSTHAEWYAGRAREIDPEHGLSEIVLSFVLAGHLPDWAFRPARGR